MNIFNTKRIKSEISILDVAKHLNLNKSGQHYYCINPNHKDSKPSLSINEKDNYFHCFGCGIGGDVIKMYQIYFDINFKHSCEKLIADFNLVLNAYPSFNKNIVSSKKTKSKVNINFLCEYDYYLFDERAGIYEFERNLEREKSEKLALEFVKDKRLEKNIFIFNEFYSFCKNSVKDGIDDDVLHYLVNERKLTETVIQNNKIFSFSDYLEVNKYMKSKFDNEELKGSGLFKDGNLIFKSSHRLIIPYIENGQIVYLRARNFDTNGKTNLTSVKYFGLKSDSTELNTIKRLYNRDIILKINHSDDLYICEGEIDCLILNSLELNAVAIPGVNSIPIEELKKLDIYNIILCFDRDIEGKKATKKLIDLFYKIGIEANFVRLPNGVKDVSEFIIKEYLFKTKS